MIALIWPPALASWLASVSPAYIHGKHVGTVRAEYVPSKALTPTDNGAPVGAKAKIMNRNTLAACLTWSAFPVSTIGIADYGILFEIQVRTAVGGHITSAEAVASFRLLGDAVAYVATAYGLRRQASDGDTHSGYWLA